MMDRVAPEPGSRQPRAVIWDLGNVLIDWRAVEAVAAGVGRDEAERFMAANDFDFMAFNHGPDAGLDWDEALAAVRESHPHWLAHATAYREHFAASLVGEVPGTAALVAALAAAGVSQWGLTNWSAELYPHAPRLFSAVRALDGVVVSGVEGVAKPDPAIYRLSAERAGLAPQDLVFVDDRADNVAAALEVGMRGIVFTGADDVRARLRSLALPV